MTNSIDSLGTGGGSSYYSNQDYLGTGGAPGHLETYTQPPVAKDTYLPSPDKPSQESFMGSFFKSVFSAIGYILSGPTACTPKATNVIIASPEIVRPSETIYGPRINTGGSFSQVNSLTRGAVKFEKRDVPANYAYDFANQLLEGMEVDIICVDRVNASSGTVKAENCLSNDTTQIPASSLKVPGRYVLWVRQIRMPSRNVDIKIHNVTIWFNVVASPSN